MQSAIQQLLLSKYLFQKGSDALLENGPYSAGLAVSLFQDAIELMARTVATHVDAKIEKNTSFETIWDKIKEAPKSTGRELPLKTKCIALNVARVGFKHYGNLPDAKNAARFQADTELFLDESSALFFGLKLDSISMADLIQHEKAKDHLHKAETALLKGDFQEVLIECAHAHYYLSQALSSMLPPLGNDVSGAVRSIEPYGNVLESVVGVMKDHFNGLRDFTIASTLGMSLIDFVRFRFIKPGISRSPFTGSTQIQLHAGRVVEQGEAAFAIKFVTDYGIAAQTLLSGLSTNDRKLMFGNDA